MQAICRLLRQGNQAGEVLAFVMMPTNSSVDTHVRVFRTDQSNAYVINNDDRIDDELLNNGDDHIIFT